MYRAEYVAVGEDKPTVVVPRPAVGVPSLYAYIDSIRRSAQETMRLAIEKPEAVTPVLADIPDDTWQAMILTLRYSDNYRVARHLK